MKNARQAGIEPDNVSVRGGAPSLEVDFTDDGYRYFGIRPLADGSLYVRGYHFVMPFTQLRSGQKKNEVHGHYWVPIDDENCMVWNFYHSHGDEELGKRESQESSGNAYGSQVDVKNGFRPLRNRSNNWMIDRKM